MPLSPDLAWTGGDPDGDAVVYDVYLEADDATPDTLLASSQTGTMAPAGTLLPNRDYYWQVLSRDSYGAVTTGPVWHFVTADAPNQAPYEPANPIPADGATGQMLDVTLSWAGGDPDSDPVIYDLYFEADDATPDVLVSSGQAETSFDPTLLVAGEQYYWRVAATDSHSASVDGPVWNFSTYLAGVWEEIGLGSAAAGGVSDNEGDSRLPELAIGVDDTPYLVWLDDSSGAWQVYSRHWDGAAWQAVGADSATGGGISDMVDNLTPDDHDYVSVGATVDTSGTLYVAWPNQADGDAEIYVWQWDGLVWDEAGAGSASAGGISDNAGKSTQPTADAGTSNSVFVAWYDYSDSGGDAEIYVRRWDGDSWNEVGTGSASGGGVSNNNGLSIHPDIAAAPDGTIFIAWADGSSGNQEIYVRQWDGSQWAEIGEHSASGQGISDNTGLSTSPSLAVDPDGIPYVAWSDLSSGSAAAVYVRRWNGVLWEEVGDGSATNFGISESYSGPTNSVTPVIAIDSSGRAYVAWSQYTGTHFNVYVKRWNGVSWEEVGNGSASGDGLSNSSLCDSVQPALAVGPNDVPVLAWQEACAGDDGEIFTLRWVE